MTHRPDVAICGAGAAGLAAAVTAARQGRRVCLIEARPDMGGTVVHALIHTLGGLYDSSGQLINDGLPAELVHRLTRADAAVRPRRMGRLWVLSVCPRTYREVVRSWLGGEERITVLTRTRIVRVVTRQGRISEIEATGPRGTMRLRPKAVIDATGSAAVVRRIDPRLVHEDSRRAAAGWIFTLRGVVPGALAFPQGVGIVRALRAAAADGTLPTECGQAWIDAGVADDEVYVKLFVPLADGWRDRERRGEITRELQQTQARVTAFLRESPGFSGAVPGCTGALGIRDDGRIRGEYCLTEADVRAGQRFDDAACRGCWPIEYWDPVDGVSVEYLPDGRYYEIPLRALAVQGVGNVWGAGKCLSADRYAQASARVAGTCWAMGEAAGKAAAAL